MNHVLSGSDQVSQKGQQNNAGKQMKKSVQIMQPFWITMEANKEQTTTSSVAVAASEEKTGKTKRIYALEKVESEFDLSVQ